MGPATLASKWPLALLFSGLCACGGGSGGESTGLGSSSSDPSATANTDDAQEQTALPPAGESVTDYSLRDSSQSNPSASQPPPSLRDYGCDSALDLERSECGPEVNSNRTTCTAISSNEESLDAPCEQRWQGCSDGNNYRVTCVPQSETAAGPALACGCLVNGRVRGSFGGDRCPLAQDAVNAGCGWNILWGDLR